MAVKVLLIEPSSNSVWLLTGCPVSLLHDLLRSLLNAHVDFTAIAAGIDRSIPRPGRAKGGRPPYPTELMIRLLVLQQLFNLSDEQVEYQVLDRMSFQRFARLPKAALIPDRNTLWFFVNG